DCVDIPFLKLNGTATDVHDYNILSVRKTHLEDVLEMFISMICVPLMDIPSCSDCQYVIDRFRSTGFKDELLAKSFHDAALQKSIATFKLKADLFAVEKNDPLCVYIGADEEITIRKRHDLCLEQTKKLFEAAFQLSSEEK
ncbi:unnamed protein product, partial [Didymodactylos carnosus]